MTSWKCSAHAVGDATKEEINEIHRYGGHQKDGCKESSHDGKKYRDSQEGVRQRSINTINERITILINGCGFRGCRTHYAV